MEVWTAVEKTVHLSLEKGRTDRSAFSKETHNTVDIVQKYKY